MGIDVWVYLHLYMYAVHGHDRLLFLPAAWLGSAEPKHKSAGADRLSHRAVERDRDSFSRISN